MKPRASISTLILVLLLLVPALSQSQTARSNESTDKDDSAKPVITEKPDPESPGDYRGPKIEAVVVLRAVFRSSGKITDIKLEKVIPNGTSEKLSKDLVKRCIKAARKIKFTPAIKDGHPASMLMELEYSFHLY
jgi:hypothetical protein